MRRLQDNGSDCTAIAAGEAQPPHRNERTQWRIHTRSQMEARNGGTTRPLIYTVAPQTMPGRATSLNGPHNASRGPKRERESWKRMRRMYTRGYRYAIYTDTRALHNGVLSRAPKADDNKFAPEQAPSGSDIHLCAGYTEKGLLARALCVSDE